jgi:hypothetical protein
MEAGYFATILIILTSDMSELGDARKERCIAVNARLLGKPLGP